MNNFEPPIRWTDYEDIAMKLHERFGNEFTEGRIYRVRFTDLLEWVLQIPGFVGTREESSEGHLEMIQSSWVYEWRDNQKPSDSNVK
jgi:FeS assembly protein IscX